MAVIEFTNNIADLSTDKGYQFKFHCDRCGDGYMSSFETNPLGVVGGLLETASSIFGGVFGRGAAGAYEIQRAVGGPQHDSALDRAVQEVKPQFNKCRRCGKWTCLTVCYNRNADLCKDCAPVAEEEETAIRAEFVRNQVRNDTNLEEEQRLKLKASEAAATCPSCGTPTLGKKFCPGCGTRLEVVQNCGGCGAKLPPGAKFCGECGAKAV